jgi:hypothetical protein
MHDTHYVVELANAYNCALITRDKLRDEIHTCSLEEIMYGVIIVSEDYSDDDAAAFVVAADVPIVWERWFTREELDSDPETSWMPEGTWPARRQRRSHSHAGPPAPPRAHPEMPWSWRTKTDLPHQEKAG